MRKIKAKPVMLLSSAAGDFLEYFFPIAALAAEKQSRPACCTDEQLKYLDELRESGVTNMFGAGSYLEDKFDLSHADAAAILGYWMETFGDPNR